MNRRNTIGLSLNCLEDRSVPAVLASLSNGTLLVGGFPTLPGAVIRVDGQSNPVRVFDGPKMVGAFDSVKSIDARPDGNANLRIELSATRSYDWVSVTVSRGINNVRIDGGHAEKVAILGNGGIDRITVAGLSSQLLVANTGLGQDELLVGRSEIGAVVVNSAERVDLMSCELGSVDLVNQSTPMNVNVVARIKDHLAVNQFGGSMNLGGLVQGDVSYLSARNGSAATLNVTGTIAGSLTMVGTESNDVVNLARGSQIFGPVNIALGGMNDRMTLDGMIGRRGTPAKIDVDMGAGNDQVMVRESAVLHAFGSIDMGAGRDLVSIARQAYFIWLKVDGGADSDMVEAPTGQTNLTLSNFEVVGA